MSRRSWTADEDHALSVAVAKYGAKSWKRIATYVKDRDHSQCLQRWRKTLDPTLIKGFWSKEEDQQLTYLVTTNPTAPWAKIAAQIPGRFIRQCRDRWNTALNPGVDKSSFTKEEDKILIDAVATLGTAWTSVATLLPGRIHTRVYETAGVQSVVGEAKKQGRLHMPLPRFFRPVRCHTQITPLLPSRTPPYP
jgi:hypothetical protein